MVIKIGDKVLVKGVECEVCSVHRECDNPICVVERSDTGEKQRVRLTEADLVERGEGEEKEEEKEGEKSSESSESSEAENEGGGESPNLEDNEEE